MVLKNTCSLFLIFILTLSYGESARILAIFHVPSRSHHILVTSLLKGLAERGHEVTMVSPYPFKAKIKNYRDIFLENMLAYKENNLQHLMTHNSTISKSFGGDSSHMFIGLCHETLSNNEFQKLKSENFDLVIQLALYSECLLGVSHHFKAPVIMFSTIGNSPRLYEFTGDILPSFLGPLSSTPGVSGIAISQRLKNILSYLSFYLLSEPHLRQQEKILHEYFPEAPNLDDLIKNVSLVFVNSHYAIDGPIPYPPNLIPVAGIHIEEPKELPADLKKFLDEATDGAIFVSLGSNVKITSLPKEVTQAIFNTLSKLRMRVLFKSDMDIPGLPDNIKIGKWLPQNDVLAHPNVKLFISHGGLLSIIEAIYYGIPILGIPFFGDQHSNVARAVLNGYGLKIDIEDINEDNFSEVVNEILINPRYKENILFKSSLLRDDPFKPLNKAIYWVEHVLKYKGGAHLKNDSQKLDLYKYILTDVMLLIIIVVVVCVILLQLIVKYVSRHLKLFLKNAKVKTN